MKIYRVRRDIALQEIYPEFSGSVKGKATYLVKDDLIASNGRKFYRIKRENRTVKVAREWANRLYSSEDLANEPSVIIHVDDGKYSTNQTYVYNGETNTEAIGKAFVSFSWPIAKIIVQQCLEDWERMPREWLYDRYQAVAEQLEVIAYSEDAHAREIRRNAINALQGQDGITFLSGYLVIR